MKVVIEIDDEDYRRIHNIPDVFSSLTSRTYSAIKGGTPISKGHGRLGDLDKVADRLEALRDNWNYYGNKYESGIYTGYEYSLDEVMDAPTIIEADKTESEDKA